ncbi:hypothetical protein [Psychromonas hadalis]|uniref:hypothetical protein n=1 Tax=Psychromonas hadalis TaxID=211669 RepID=UPI0003B3CF2D|nr:hypothetical protein [Psychromonas hadalis]
MINKLLYSLRFKLRKIDWLARFYRQYILRIPFDSEMFVAEYTQVKNSNDLALSLLPLVVFNCLGLKSSDKSLDVQFLL